MESSSSLPKLDRAALRAKLLVEFERTVETVTQRLKGRGRRWDRLNPEAVMALDCLESSHAWNIYWATLDPQRN